MEMVASTLLGFVFDWVPIDLSPQIGFPFSLNASHCLMFSYILLASCAGKRKHPFSHDCTYIAIYNRPFCCCASFIRFDSRTAVDVRQNERERVGRVERWIVSAHLPNTQYPKLFSVLRFAFSLLHVHIIHTHTNSIIYTDWFCRSTDDPLSEFYFINALHFDLTFN